MSGGIAKNREKASKELDVSFHTRELQRSELFKKASDAFDFAKGWAQGLSRENDFYRNREGEWRRDFDAFNRQRSEALKKVEKLREEIKKLEALAGIQEAINKKRQKKLNIP